MLEESSVHRLSAGQPAAGALTRRRFCGAAAAGAGAAAAAAVAGAGAASATAAEAASWEPAWDDEADLIIVGYGASGVCAAIAAADAGASAIVLEKAPRREGGNMGCSGGGLHEVVPFEEWYGLYVHGAFGNAEPRSFIEPYIGHMNEMPDWFEEHDIPVTWTELQGDGFKTPSTYLSGAIVDYGDGHNGPYLFMGLDEAAQERDVDVRLSTAGKRLVKNPETGEVAGVLAEGPDGGQLAFKARKAVLLCCGGYENNPRMQMNHIQPGVRFFPMGTPYNAGEGVEMASEMGAALWHMGLAEYHTELYRIPSELANLGVRVHPSECGSHIFIDKNGKRYTNERHSLSHVHPRRPEFEFDDATGEMAHMPIFMVFDQSVYDELNPLWVKDAKVAGRSPGYTQSMIIQFGDDDFGLDWPDNDYAQQQGWIFKGDTIEELAANIRSDGTLLKDGSTFKGVDAEALAATVEAWNAACEAGEDAEFGRDPETMGKLANPPFYAIEIANGIMNTNGGPVRNEWSQTMNAYGEPIGRLYSCGELGSVNVLGYNTGNLLEACTTGRVAAEHAAKLEAWG